VNQEKQLKKEERKRVFNRSRSSFQNVGTETNKTNNTNESVEADDDSVTDDSEDSTSDENPEQEQDTILIKENQAPSDSI